MCSMIDKKSVISDRSVCRWIRMAHDVVHGCKVMLNSTARFIGERSKPTCESRFAVYIYIFVPWLSQSDQSDISIGGS